MSDAATSSNPAVYQLRVVLAGVSPLIWRRLLVPAEATIAELHAVLQAAFGWGGEHLHRFVIHGTEYGISSLGGPGFRDDARGICLGELVYEPVSASPTRAGKTVGGYAARACGSGVWVNPSGRPARRTVPHRLRTMIVC
ncbi:MAG: plasmid pRiA4b ORF-3 family protein [Pseudonocardiaceae bacterium]